MAERASGHGGKRPGSGRPASGRDDIAVKMDRAIVARARYVAELRSITLAEYLSEGIRATVDRDFDRAVRDGSKGTERAE